MQRRQTSPRRRYTRLSSKRQVTLPIRVIEELGLEPGAQLRVDVEDGKIILSRGETLAAQRSRSIHRVAGSLTGAYGRGYLKKIRGESR